jgi:L-2-hydroxyglutarate oxidase LhgO
MDIAKSIALQRQIVENSKNINQYYTEFNDWVEDMNKKDNILTQIKLKEPKKEVIVSSGEDEKERLEKIKNAHKEAQMNKYKRDKNSIKDYYDNWDKVDADAELVDVDSGISINSNSNDVKEL